MQMRTALKNILKILCARRAQEVAIYCTFIILLHSISLSIPVADAEEICGSNPSMFETITVDEGDKNQHKKAIVEVIFEHTASNSKVAIKTEDNMVDGQFNILKEIDILDGDIFCLGHFTTENITPDSDDMFQLDHECIGAYEHNIYSINPFSREKDGTKWPETRSISIIYTRKTKGVTLEKCVVDGIPNFSSPLSYSVQSFETKHGGILTIDELRRVQKR